MTEAPRVSVCVPSYNHAKYVRQAIESVLAQDFQDFEIVITDDCSTDDTVAILQSFEDPRISFTVHERNMGPSVAINRCIAQARGTYVTLLASDDLFEPWKLSRQLREFEARPELGAVFSYMRHVDEDGAPIDRTPDDLSAPRDMDRARALRTLLLAGNCISAPTAMMRRDVVARVGAFDPRLLQTQDYEFWIRLCLRAEIAIVEEPLVRYRIRAHAANMDANSPAKFARLYWELPRVLEQFLHLEDEALLLRAFPETRPFLDAGLGPRAALALVALSAPLHWTRAFGIEALYRELGDPASAERLAKASFGNPYFFRMLAEVDPARSAAEARAHEADASAREAWSQREDVSRYLKEVEVARDWFRDEAAKWEAEYRRATRASTL